MRQASAKISGSASVRTLAPARSLARAANCSASTLAGSTSPAKSCVTTPMRGAGIDAGSSNSGRPVIAERPHARSSTPAANSPTVSSVHEKHLTPTGRQQPIARLDRRRAAERGRPDHRAAGLRAQRQRDHAGADRRGRARRRSARRVAVIVRIERGGRIIGGKGRGRGLADDGRTRPLEHGTRPAHPRADDSRDRSASPSRSESPRCR